MQTRNSESYKWSVACWTLLALAGMLIIWTAGDYGDSWDEKVRSDAGEAKLSYYQALFKGDWAEARRIGSMTDHYPGFHDLNLTLLRRVSPLGDHLTGNLFGAALGFLGICGAMALGKRLGGPAAGFWTVVFLLTLPGYYGHLFINPKDVPFAFGYVWALVFIHDWIGAAGRPARRTVLLTGISIGIATATRIGGIVLLCYLVLFLVLDRATDRRTGSGGVRWRHVAAALAKDLPSVAAAGAIAGCILLAYWPHGQWQPFAHAGATLAAVTHYDWQMPVLFEGRYLDAASLPWYYLPKMIGITTPVHLLLLFFAGAWIWIREARLEQPNSSSDCKSRLGCGLVLFACVFPVAYILARGSVVYNGTRHILFILPPAMAIAGHAAAGMLKIVHARRAAGSAAAAGLLALLAAATGTSMVQLHPYQYIYYNFLAGGTADAAARYETDYWGTAYKELAEQFYNHLELTRPTFSRPMIVVNMEHVTWLFTPFIPPSGSLPIHVVRSRPDIGDYYAAGTSWEADEFYDGETVVSVERAGVILAVIKDRRDKMSNSVPADLVERQTQGDGSGR